MQRLFVTLITLFFAGAVLMPQNSAEARYWHKKKGNSKAAAKMSAPKKKGKEKPFSKVIKDFEKVEGLFDFYVDKDENKTYMAIKPENLDKIYLCNMTRTAGDGTYFDAGAQAGAFPFKIVKIGKKIQFLAVNLNYRADEDTPISGALEKSISNSLWGSTKIESKPDTSGAFLIDPSGILVTDVPNVNYFLGQMGKTGYRFDGKNSNFGVIKSFPNNSEIDVHLHYATSKPTSSTTSASGYSMFLTYHYSLSSIPESDYVPRLADDRVGYFLTTWQDYTDLEKESAYTRYINRWNLKKKNPAAAMSEPVEPIVWWLENTIPVEYREMIKEGVLFWNKAFEKIGFKNVMVVKQMPDSADWDPADVRYNVVRWMVTPGTAYAVGPSRANPFTGQLYDADIRIAADFIRSMFNYSERFIDPVAYGIEPVDEQHQHEADEWINGKWQPLCNYGYEAMYNNSEALALLGTAMNFQDYPEITKKFVHEYIIQLVSHEIGHTLGLRHNFKASSIHNHEQLMDENYTKEHGLTGTTMEYAGVSFAREGETQGQYHQTTPGPYDYWAIEYGYKPLNAQKPADEKKDLDRIAARSGTDPRLVYLTDEDCFGNSSRAIDPMSTVWDIGNDPISYWSNRIELSRKLWSKIESEFEKPNASYRKLRTVFAYGWGGFRSGAAQMARFVGGYDHHRYHVGDTDITPFTPIPAKDQRAAIQYIRDKVWAPGVFQFDPNLLNKLQPERLEGLSWSDMYAMKRLDYPLHDMILSAQIRPLWHIYNSTTLARIHDIEMHYGKGEDVYTMTEIFQDVRRAIWSPELVNSRNVNSVRRNLQREHLKVILNLVTNTKMNVPEDARTLARVDLKVLKGAMNNAINSGSLNTITKGHFEESLARINAALKANIDYKM